MRTKFKKLSIACIYFVYKIIKIPIKCYWKIFNIETKGVRVMLIQNKEIILVRHWYNPLWVMPGGGVHKHETPEQSAVREIKEEVGIDIGQLDYLLGIYSNINEGKKDTVYCFVVELDSKVKIQNKKFNIEISDSDWFSLFNLPSHTSRATRTRIEEYLASKISKEIRFW